MLRRGPQRDVRRIVAVRGIARPLELDGRAGELREAFREAGNGVRGRVRERVTPVVSLGVDDEAQERQLNIHLDPEQMAGVYANFANVTFSPYEFTLTFARIDHEIEEGDVPGVVTSRVNMSSQFFQELLAAMQDSFSKWSTQEGIRNLPEAPPRSDSLAPQARRTPPPARPASGGSDDRRGRREPSPAGSDPRDRRARSP